MGEPLTDEEIERCREWYDGVTEDADAADIRQSRWLATVDALRARLDEVTRERDRQAEHIANMHEAAISDAATVGRLERERDEVTRELHRTQGLYSKLKRDVNAEYWNGVRDENASLKDRLDEVTRDLKHSQAFLRDCHAMRKQHKAELDEMTRERDEWKDRAFDRDSELRAERDAAIARVEEARLDLADAQKAWDREHERAEQAEAKLAAVREANRLTKKIDEYEDVGEFVRDLAGSLNRVGAALDATEPPDVVTREVLRAKVREAAYLSAASCGLSTTLLDASADRTVARVLGEEG